MNREELIRTARDAHGEMLASGKGVYLWHGDAYVEDVQDFCGRFAALVAAAEREACAKVCDARYMGDNSREDMEAKRCAAAIRARGEQEQLR